MEKETVVWAKVARSDSLGIIILACRKKCRVCAWSLSKCFPVHLFRVSLTLRAFPDLPETQNADARLLIRPWTEKLKTFQHRDDPCFISLSITYFKIPVLPLVEDIQASCALDYEERNTASSLDSEARNPSTWDLQRTLLPLSISFSAAPSPIPQSLPQFLPSTMNKRRH